MAFDVNLGDRIREHLLRLGFEDVEERQMFSGLTFMVDDKMCISVSGDGLMCRYDPSLQAEVAEKKGFSPMIMKGKEMRGYCYVSPEGFRSKTDFAYWVNLCLDFNSRAKSSKKKAAGAHGKKPLTNI